MRLLLVEDKEDIIADLQKELATRGTIQVSAARSRDRALELIDSEMFDFAVVDLKIPPTEGSLDTDTSHGLAVRAALAERSAGTPAVIFSAFGTMPLVQSLLDTTRSYDVWQPGSTHPMTRFLNKGELSKCVALINKIEDEIAALSRIELSFGAQPLELTYHERTILLIFARMFEGAHVRVSALGGGLSGARTCRVQVEDDHRVTTCYAVVKLGPIADLVQEHQRFQNLVLPILNVGAFAYAMQLVLAGGGATGGLFYRLAKEHDSTLLEALQTTPDSTGEIVGRMKELEAPWQHAAPIEQVPVSTIRSALISDADIQAHANELEFDWISVEKVEVRITRCRQHRDLHALNVLLKNRKEPLLIDFGEVGLAPASLDPLTLELSLIFHPACESMFPGWPSLEQAQQWDNLDVFTSGCPVSNFIRACREWAFDVEAGDSGVFATAYAYAVRQLKYPKTNHTIAAAIAQAAARRLLQK